jgi:hypothetical protein
MHCLSGAQAYFRRGSTGQQLVCQLIGKTVLDKKSVQGFSIGVRLYYGDQDVVYFLVSVIPPAVEPMKFPDPTNQLRASRVPSVLQEALNYARTLIQPLATR